MHNAKPRRLSRTHRRTVVALVAVTIFSTLVAGTSLPLSEVASGASASSAMNPAMLVRAGLSQVDYVLWSKPCGQLMCYQLERLSDGGQIGLFVTAPPITSTPALSGNLNELVFANAQDGYAVESDAKGSVLYATFNGGASWRKEQIRPDQSVAWMTTTSTNFYAVTNSCTENQKNCNNWQLNRSPATASVWSAMPLPLETAHAMQPPDVAAYGSNVWLTGQQQAEPGKSLLASSRLYGQGFNVASVPTLQSVNGCQLEAMSTTDLWAQCDYGMMAGALPYSDDGGVHWVLKKYGPLGQFRFGSFDPVSSTVAYFVSEMKSYGLYRVTNGASTISAVGRSPDPVTPGLSALVFTNATQGLALSDPIGNSQRQYLYRTENSGRDWARVSR